MNAPDDHSINPPMYRCALLNDNKLDVRVGYENHSKKWLLPGFGYAMHHLIFLYFVSYESLENWGNMYFRSNYLMLNLHVSTLDDELFDLSF